MTLNLYHIERLDDGGYDTYSDAVVVAANEDDAKLIHPGGEYIWGENYYRGVIGWVSSRNSYYKDDGSWITPDLVQVKLVGVATDELQPNTVICASYHAG